MTGAPLSFVVEILLPTATGDGTAIEQEWFEELLKELTTTFGGATSFVRTPGEGLWRSGGETQQDNIAVIEVMVDELEPHFWKTLRKRFERELLQQEVVIRAHEIKRF